MQRTFHANSVAAWSKVLQGAAMDRSTELKLGVPADLLGSASFLVRAEGRPEAVRHFTAQAHALDHWLAADPRVDVLKIDAEGAEPLIWDGASGVLGANRDLKVFLEFCPPMVAETRAPAEFLAQIRQQGFSIQSISFRAGRLSTPSDSELLQRDWSELLLTRG
jgi:FkbM family methyltransferase